MNENETRGGWRQGRRKPHRHSKQSRASTARDKFCCCTFVSRPPRAPLFLLVFAFLLHAGPLPSCYDRPPLLLLQLLLAAFREVEAAAVLSTGAMPMRAWRPFL